MLKGREGLVKGKKEKVVEEKEEGILIGKKING